MSLSRFCTHCRRTSAEPAWSEGGARAGQLVYRLPPAPPAPGSRSATGPAGVGWALDTWWPESWDPMVSTPVLSPGSVRHNRDGTAERRHHRRVTRARICVCVVPLPPGLDDACGYAVGGFGSGQSSPRTGAPRDDDRLIGVRLDLTDPGSIEEAAAAIVAAVGAPYGLVHNAEISAAGMVEETPVDLWERMFTTNIFGPVALTKALLPSMRKAGRGRIVLVSSESGVRGMPATAPYSAVKGALDDGEVDGRRGVAVRDRRDDSGGGYLRHRDHHRCGHHRLP